MIFFSKNFGKILGEAGETMSWSEVKDLEAMGFQQCLQEDLFPSSKGCDCCPFGDSETGPQKFGSKGPCDHEQTSGFPLFFVDLPGDVHFNLET